MGTTATAPNATETLKVQSSVFDLDSMSDVTLVKQVSFTPVTNNSEALARVNNDAAKFLEILNRGLRSVEQSAAKDNDELPWLIEDEDGKLVPFAGTPADSKTVNGMVLNMAKASFGYFQAKDADGRRASKEQAMAFIKSQPVLIEGMKAQLKAAQAADNS
jgi:hypothetical protein